MIRNIDYFVSHRNLRLTAIINPGRKLKYDD